MNTIRVHNRQISYSFSDCIQFWRGILVVMKLSYIWEASVRSPPLVTDQAHHNVYDGHWSGSSYYRSLVRLVTGREISGPAVTGSGAARRPAYWWWWRMWPAPAPSSRTGQRSNLKWGGERVGIMRERERERIGIQCLWWKSYLWVC